MNLLIWDVNLKRKQMTKAPTHLMMVAHMRVTGNMTWRQVKEWPQAMESALMLMAVSTLAILLMAITTAKAP